MDGYWVSVWAFIAVSACCHAASSASATVASAPLPTPKLVGTHRVFTEGELDSNGFAVAA